MYRSFSIHHFRCFESLTLNDLGRINLIGGANNTGKTSLLEAIYLHAGGFHKDLALRDDHTPNAMRLFDWDRLFFNFDVSTPIHLAPQSPIDQTAIPPLTISILPREALLTSISPEFISIALGFDFEEAANFTYGHPIAKSHYYIAHHQGFLLLEFAPKLNPIVYLSSSSKSNLADIFFKLVISSKRNLLVDTLRLLEPRLTHIEELQSTLYAHLEGLHKPIPFADLGEGLQRLTNIMIGLLKAQDGILLIDEIENGLYHETLPDVWHAIYQAATLFNVQIFATTHSYEMISAAQAALGDSDGRLRYIRLERQSDGQIIAVDLDQSALEFFAQMNIEVR